jgi:hypothetical protein
MPTTGIEYCIWLDSVQSCSHFFGSVQFHTVFSHVHFVQFSLVTHRKNIVELSFILFPVLSVLGTKHFKLL